MLLAMGWNNERIANALDVARSTLEKHFPAVLKARDKMRDRLRARQLEIAWREAEKGNVGAMREFQRLVERNDLMLADVKAKGEDEPVKPVKPPKLGKKEQALEDAKQAGLESSWGSDLIN